MPKKHTPRKDPFELIVVFRFRSLAIAAVLNLLFVFTVIGFSLFYLAKSETTMGVVDTLIHSVRSVGTRRLYMRNSPTTDTVVGFHDTSGVYHRFTTTLDFGPEGSPVPVRYTLSSVAGLDASVDGTMQLLLVILIPIFHLPLILILKFYDVSRQAVAPHTPSIFVRGLFFIVGFALCLSYLVNEIIYGGISIPFAIGILLIVNGISGYLLRILALLRVGGLVKEN